MHEFNQLTLEWQDGCLWTLGSRGISINRICLGFNTAVAHAHYLSY